MNWQYKESKNSAKDESDHAKCPTVQFVFMRDYVNKVGFLFCVHAIRVLAVNSMP